MALVSSRSLIFVLFHIFVYPDYFLSKTSFTGPATPMYLGKSFINIVSHTTCLGLVIDNRLTWATHIDHVKKSFAQKVGELKRMKKLQVKVMEEIYFKSILPAVTYGIVVRGNCSSSGLFKPCSSESHTSYLPGCKP